MHCERRTQLRRANLKHEKKFKKRKLNFYLGDILLFGRMRRREQAKVVGAPQTGYWSAQWFSDCFVEGEGILKQIPARFLLLN